jgi:anti-sigma factor RsiW
VNCTKAMQELSSYLDRELDAELKKTLEAHLAFCNHCHAVYDSTKKTLEIYCDEKLFTLPEEVHHRLHEALKRKCQKR